VEAQAFFEVDPKIELEIARAADKSQPPRSCSRPYGFTLTAYYEIGGTKL
jgi:hypothetical protein